MEKCPFQSAVDVTALCVIFDKLSRGRLEAGLYCLNKLYILSGEREVVESIQSIIGCCSEPEKLYSALKFAEKQPDVSLLILI